MTTSEFKGPWVCFHCGEVCQTDQEALDHFGYTEDEMPACITILKEGEKAIIEDRREWKERCLHEQHENERMSCELSNLRWSIWEIVRGRVTRQNRCDHPSHVEELKWVWESMEGRALAAESALNAAPKWLRSFLRQRAEKRAMLILKKARLR